MLLLPSQLLLHLVFVGTLGFRGRCCDRFLPLLLRLRVSHLSICTFPSQLTSFRFRCITRRRRSRGLQPYYGTGWMPFHPTNPNGDAQQFHNFPPQHQQYDSNQHYDPNNPHTQYYAPPTAPAPPYTPSPQIIGTHFPTPPLPQENQFGYQPPPPQGPGNSPYGIRQQSTGGTGGTEYYLPPPGPPPAAHVGKH